MEGNNRLINKYFERDSIIGKKIILYDYDTTCYSNLVEYLKNKSVEICCCSNDIIYILDKILEIQPSFIILSIIKTELTITELIRVIRKHSPCTHIILQLSLNILLVLPIENLNVSGIILQNTDSSEIIECLKTILDGFRFLGKGIQNVGNKQVTAELLSSVNITKQEQKIMALIAEGITKNQKIAEKLYLSPHTIKNHKDHLIKKLKLNTVQELYFIARQKWHNDNKFYFNK